MERQLIRGFPNQTRGRGFWKGKVWKFNGIWYAMEASRGNSLIYSFTRWENAIYFSIRNIPNITPIV